MRDILAQEYNITASGDGSSNGGDGGGSRKWHTPPAAAAAAEQRVTRDIARQCVVTRKQDL